ncbi:MAG: isoprenylcysteine carboxylmethyltransferase family protein [Desulfobacteraceae bacterium]|nr:MAG: isoprenylcysteine carboxylmethyltransferase family protein [Desulfobacteraceae bacterium]
MIEEFRTHITKGFAILVVLLMCIGESHWDDALPSLTTMMIFSGILLVGVASAGRLWCSLYIAGYKTNRLVTQGPYSMCRNPLYFFSFIGAVGVGLSSETFIIPLLILVAFGLYYPFVIRKEEKRLLHLHREEFKRYLSRVPRFFPKLSLLEEPLHYQVKPVRFKKQMFDVLWFVWVLGVIEIIEECHRQDIFPAIITIY